MHTASLGTQSGRSEVTRVEKEGVKGPKEGELVRQEYEEQIALWWMEKRKNDKPSLENIWWMTAGAINTRTVQVDPITGG